MTAPLWIQAVTAHRRHEAPAYGFTHTVDYVLIDPESTGPLPRLFSRNRRNIAAVHDRDYGFAGAGGTGPAWARGAAARMGYPGAQTAALRLITAPRLLGGLFNPVSFWLFIKDGDALCAVIAEVNNTYGDRHAYLCHAPGFRPLTAADRPEVQKLFHVSPFRDVRGTYGFTFDIRPARIAIRIEHVDGDNRLMATLSGTLEPLTNAAVLRALLRRPFAPVRTLALIYWHALRLRLKGALFRARPKPPIEEISR